MADAPFTFLPRGAIIQSMVVNGINIVHGFDTTEDYASHNSPFFGETIGRVANRISNAKIDSLNNGKSYPLLANDGPNSLHGGKEGWGKRTWDGPKPVGLREIPGVEGLKGGESVEFKLVSEDGDEGFPGKVEVTIVYTTGTQVVDGGKEAIVLGMDYEAKLVDGADETTINMTNHSYFNLSGDPTTADTDITLATRNALPVDSGSIPTGGPAPFPDLDTSKPFHMTTTGPAVDHCFVVNTNPASVPIDTRYEPLICDLDARNTKTGIHLQVLSTEPSFQFYTGKHINVPAVGSRPARGTRAGFCCEPGRYVNAINVPEWRNMAVLKKGETYGSRIVYKAWAD